MRSAVAGPCDNVSTGELPPLTCGTFPKPSHLVLEPKPWAFHDFLPLGIVLNDDIMDKANAPAKPCFPIDKLVAPADAVADDNEPARGALNMRGWRGRTLQALVILGAAFLVAADPDTNVYSTVGRAEPLNVSFQNHLKEAREWLLDKDYASAAQSAQELAALAHLLAYHYPSLDGQTKAKELCEAVESLTVRIKEKEQAGCQKAVAKCEAAAKTLAALPAETEKVAIKNYKPSGSTKTWMMLMDAAYVDGKSTKDARAFEQQALTLAEEANAAAFLRTDARWRQFSREVRDLALEAARKARESDVATARLTLKRANERCEACHQGYRR
jgi:hypothetical protein